MEEKYYTVKGKLLDDLSARDGEYIGADTKEAFEKNLQMQPNDWIYRTKKIYYKHNSQGYRTQEFDTIDWANSIVMLGCSNVYGVGLADDETVCYQLEQITGIPVINLGIGGSSIAFATYNQLALYEQGARPRAVVNMWTTADRLLYFATNHTISIGPWTLTLTPRFKQLFMKWAGEDSNPLGNAWMCRRTCQMLWQDIPHYECTFFDHLQFDVEQFGRIDLARDLMHPGVESMQIAAKKIAQELEL